MITISISLIIVIFCIMALNNKRILISFRMLLSLITSYWMLNLKFNYMIHIWSDKEYIPKNINHIIDNGIVFWWFIFMGCSYFIFYFLIELILRKISLVFILNFYNKKIDLLGENKKGFKKSVSIFTIRVVKKIFSIEDTRPLTKQEIEGIINNIYNVFCLLIHFIVCWFILRINNAVYMMLISLFVMIISLIYILFILPVLRLIKIPMPKDE